MLLRLVGNAAWNHENGKGGRVGPIGIEFKQGHLEILRAISRCLSGALKRLDIYILVSATPLVSQCCSPHAQLFQISYNFHDTAVEKYIGIMQGSSSIDFFDSAYITDYIMST